MKTIKTIMAALLATLILALPIAAQDPLPTDPGGKTPPPPMQQEPVGSNCVSMCIVGSDASNIYLTWTPGWQVGWRLDWKIDNGDDSNWPNDFSTGGELSFPAGTSGTSFPVAAGVHYAFRLRTPFTRVIVNQ